MHEVLSLIRRRFTKATNGVKPTPRDGFQVFHFFPQLPTELRLMIWEYNLLPRCIEIKATQLVKPQLKLSKQECHYTYVCRVPANLHVCRESRQEALKQYSLRFGIGGLVDPISDVLYFGPSMVLGCPKDWFSIFMSQLHPEDMARIRHIAISNSMLTWHFSYYAPSFQLALQELFYIINLHLVNLEQLTIVCHGIHYDHVYAGCRLYGSTHIKVVVKAELPLEAPPDSPFPPGIEKVISDQTYDDISACTSPCQEHN
ncbi:hypothetical protein F5Y00DRAFT_106511 [Daldinia vernicosa]|uniref:uncharacterized protein n=1 Tax=Daldinia vernicosa TaxID=114800 RepID=UPI002007953A|nr:uncharacterized protein F5Y00DRAFT_106511 [Daldinia vernicosa]KAI0847876.1 hypothetical protein F5Y00DRAFT_106511 [Daldinia vernicosa]